MLIKISLKYKYKLIKCLYEKELQLNDYQDKQILN